MLNVLTRNCPITNCLQKFQANCKNCQDKENALRNIPDQKNTNNNSTTQFCPGNMTIVGQSFSSFNFTLSYS